jgi:hypothetical protein
MYQVVQPSNVWCGPRKSNGSAIPTGNKMDKEMVCEIFQQLVNIAVHKAFVVYNSRNKTHHLTYRLDLIQALLLTHKPQVASPAGPGRPPINPPSERIFGRHFIEMIPATGKKAKPQRCCAVCSL